MSVLPEEDRRHFECTYMFKCNKKPCIDCMDCGYTWNLDYALNANDFHKDPIGFINDRMIYTFDSGKIFIVEVDDDN